MYEDMLGRYMGEELSKIPDLMIQGLDNGIVTFTIKGIHPHDIAQVLAEEGICVRAGFLCAQPLLEGALKVGPVVRASLAFYNTKEEVDKMVKVVRSVKKRLS